MPLTVADTFAAAGLEPQGPVRWGAPVPETAQGVYSVALTDDARSLDGAFPRAPLDDATLAQLLEVRPELRVSLAHADVDTLANRLNAFWLPDEVVLYIGLAGQPLRTRLRQYYRTALGAKRPHAGGWWLKTLSVLDQLWVYWAATVDYAAAEKAMLRAFADAVPMETRYQLLDHEAVMPFANLRGWDDRIKAHGITSATGDLAPAHSREATARTQVATRKVPAPRPPPPPPPPTRSDTTTQRITSRDFEAGRVRLPSRTKSLLPLRRRDIVVDVRGSELRARWDPRMGPPERSGVLAFGRGKLDGLIEVDEVLEVTAAADGKVQLQ